MKELIEEIVNHCDGIIERSERMTSGNYMHHCRANRFSANTIKVCMELLPKSVFKWRKGEPTEIGDFLVTLQSGTVTLTSISSLDRWNAYIPKDKVIAWCKLSDIEPFKEE